MVPRNAADALKFPAKMQQSGRAGAGVVHDQFENYETLF
jgi:hypothetical protein